MTKSFQPIIFLAVLFSIVTFLAGFKIGRRVEKIDQVYIPPTAIPLPTPTLQPLPTDVPLDYKTYTNKNCGISFLYPSSLGEEKISSESSQFKDGNNTILFNCNKTAVFNKKEALEELDILKEVIFNNKKINIYQKDDQTLMWIILNPLINRSVFFQTSNNLSDLIIKSLELN